MKKITKKIVKKVPVKRKVIKKAIKASDKDSKGKFVKGNSGRFVKGRKKTGGRKKKTPLQLRKAFDDYLLKCHTNKKGLMIVGMLKEMGISKDIWYHNYKNNPLYTEVVSYIMLSLEEYWTNYGLGLKSARFVIAYMKNNFGWKESKDINIGGQGEGSSPVQIVTTVADFEGAISGKSKKK